MANDLRQLLQDTAEDPTRPLDASAVVRRARRQRLAARTAAGLAVVGAVVGVAVAAQQLWPAPQPEVVNDPPPPSSAVEVPLSIVEQPQSPDDQMPDWVRERLRLDQDAAATSRLARRSPTRDYYVFVEESRPPESGSKVCVVTVADPGRETPVVCGDRYAPASEASRWFVVSRGPEGIVGMVADGIQSSGVLPALEDLSDVPVVNNVFIDEAGVDGDVAAAGRSSDAFCAAAPPTDEGPDVAAGSAAPLELVASMARTAPLEVAADAYLVWDYVRGNLDPADPTTQSLDSFPGPVQTAVERVDAFIQDNCPAAGTE